MPTRYAAQLVETETPWLEIWKGMYNALLPRARQILDHLGYYAERDLQVPVDGTPLTKEEDEEFTPIIAALTSAAVESQKMTDGVLVPTLQKLAKSPSGYVGELPATVQWELANDYRRGHESQGAFAMDIWGSEQTEIPYICGEPTPENISRAAERAAIRIQEGRARGRPPIPAHAILAKHLGCIFRGSGQTIVRHREKRVREKDGQAIEYYVETGAFHEVLELVLQPLQVFLRPQELRVSIETIARMASSARLAQRPASPNYSHNRYL